MPLELPPENWGDRLRRARLYGKRRYGYSYRELAERVAMAMPITDRALIALEHKINAPTLRRQRLIAAFYAIALGYTPESLGIDDIDDLFRAYDHQKVYDLLDPDGWSPRRRRWVDAARRRAARATERDPAPTEPTDPADPDDQK